MKTVLKKIPQECPDDDDNNGQQWLMVQKFKTKMMMMKNEIFDEIRKGFLTFTTTDHLQILSSSCGYLFCGCFFAKKIGENCFSTEK